MSADYLWTYVAKDAGIFADNGIDADIQYIASTQSIAALIAGQVDVSLGAGSDVLSAVAGGAPPLARAGRAPRPPPLFPARPRPHNPPPPKGGKDTASRLARAS